MTRIVFLCADSGAGHRRVAEAVAARLIPLGADCVITNVYAAAKARGVRRLDVLYDGLSASSGGIRLYDAVWHATEVRAVGRCLRQAADRLAGPSVDAVLSASRPDLVVVVHPTYMSHLVARSRRRLGGSFSVVTVVTDPVTPHRSWVDGECRGPVFTFSRFAAARLARFRTFAVETADFPIHPTFLESTPGVSAGKRHLGIADDQPTILIMGGGAGSGDIASYARSAAQSLPDAQIIILAGRNGRLARTLRCSTFSAAGTRVLDFIPDPRPFMDAADVVISKPGPSTIFEVVARGRRLILTRPVGRQEQGNASLAGAQGWATICPEPSALLQLLPDVLRRPNPMVASEPGDGGTVLANRLLMLARSH